MDPLDAIDLGRQAVWLMLVVSSPVLLAGLAVGLVIGLLQAMTQVQDQTVAFVPKVVTMILVLTLAMPWLLMQLIEYSAEMFGTFPIRM